MQKKLLRSLPELYLLLAILLYWFSTSNFLNPIALVLLAVVGYQLFAQKQISGISIAGIFILLNLYMVLALVSELTEFTELTSNFYQLLIGGTLFLGINLLVGTLMLVKYARFTRVQAS